MPLPCARPAAVTGRHRRLWVLLAALGVLLACSEGYPPPNAPVMDPERLSQTERLDAMNVLGKEAHPTMRWWYDLGPGCTLEVSVRRPGDGRSSFEIPLLGMLTRTPFDKIDNVYEVQLLVAAQATKAATTILESVEWVDSILMRGLLHAVQSECRTASATGTAAPP